MRRYHEPFNGSRYVLNLNTGEIHDLDNESELCRIDDIKPEHIINLDSFEQLQIERAFTGVHNDGCYYCLPQHHRC